MTDVTRILNAIEQGDAKVADELLPLVYEELRLLASQKLSREVPGQTLQATALVHEAYVRLVGSQGQNWKGSRHFFAAAAEAMRRILIENARRKQSLKHGGGHRRVNLDGIDVAIDGPSEELLALNEALDRLAERDRMKADLVKLRYFAGLTCKQAAKTLGIAHSTADEHWAYAKAWLKADIITQHGKSTT